MLPEDCDQGINPLEFCSENRGCRQSWTWIGVCWWSDAMQLSLILLILQLWANVEVSLSQDACSQIPNVPHALLSEETKKAEYAVGDVIHFPCEVGYISGPVIRYICTNNGWVAIHKGKCFLKPCELPDDTPDGYYQLTNGDEFVFGAVITYFCNNGYQMMSKTDTRTCLLDGWSNHVPICNPLSCDPPPDGEEITVKGLPENDSPILPDRFLQFSCEGPGKRLKGSSMVICGKDGHWDHPFPTCENITCEVGEMHPHLSVAGLISENKTVNVGHKLKFNCDNGLSLEGPTEVQCLQSGKWNRNFPTCTEKCTITEAHFLVNIIQTVPGKQLAKGMELKFTCRRHDYVIHGKEKVECLANGQWSAPFPTCEPPQGCGRPPSLKDGDFQGIAKYHYSHEETVRYVCQRYYVMAGSDFKTCNNGEWIGEMTCLKPCTVDEELMKRHNIRFTHVNDNKLYAAHNDVIQFSCVRGRPVGNVNMRQYCFNGVMNLPTCQ